METAPASTSLPSRLSRGLGPGKGPGRAALREAQGHVWTHSPQPVPSWGSYPGGQEGLGKAGQEQGHCWVLPLACGASEQDLPSPSGRPPRLRANPRLQALWPGVPARLALWSQSREKSALGWASLRAHGPEPGDQLGGPHSQA
ncbi:hypothetical protein D4Z77_08575, partial [Campylobacter coli]